MYYICTCTVLSVGFRGSPTVRIQQFWDCFLLHPVIFTSYPLADPTMLQGLEKDGLHYLARAVIIPLFHQATFYSNLKEQRPSQIMRLI